MDDNNLIVDMKAVSFGYPGARPVLDTLDFSLAEGQKIGLIGHNGSGKTTFLHLAVGLLKPTGGTLRLFGTPVNGEKDIRDLRPKLGLLFQDPDDQLFSPTVLEDVAFGPLNLGKSTAEAKDLARRVLSDLGLEGYEDRITHKLSGGEKRLVSLAAVLAMEPRALLLDEPTNGLHPTTRERIASILKGLEVATVIVSHDVTFLLETTHTVYAMRNGRIEPAEVHECCRDGAAQAADPHAHHHHHHHHHRSSHNHNHPDTRTEGESSREG
jgi:cobalt/nickel transport system ATP-binding protein